MNRGIRPCLSAFSRPCRRLPAWLAAGKSLIEAVQNDDRAAVAALLRQQGGRQRAGRRRRDAAVPGQRFGAMSKLPRCC